jgi:hypothetical protein
MKWTSVLPSREGVLSEIMWRTTGTIGAQYPFQNDLPSISQDLGVQLDFCGTHFDCGIWIFTNNSPYGTEQPGRHLERSQERQQSR